MLDLTYISMQQWLYMYFTIIKKGAIQLMAVYLSTLSGYNQAIFCDNDFHIVLRKNARDVFATTKNCENEVTHFYLAAILDFTVTSGDRLNNSAIFSLCIILIVLYNYTIDPGHVNHV